MSHAEAAIVGTGSIVAKTFSTNIVLKSITSFFTVLFGLVVEGNETIIGLIFLLYFVDFTTGVISALVRREYESRKFFMGATKLLIYGIFCVIGVGVGQALHLDNSFLSAIFAFIIITDSSSILENLEKLGYHTPIFLSKYLKVAHKNLERRYTDSTSLEEETKK